MGKWKEEKCYIKIKTKAVVVVIMCLQKNEKRVWNVEILIKTFFFNKCFSVKFVLKWNHSLYNKKKNLSIVISGKEIFYNKLQSIEYYIVNKSIKWYNKRSFISHGAINPQPPLISRLAMRKSIQFSFKRLLIHVLSFIMKI